MEIKEQHGRIIREMVAKKIAGDILFSQNIGLAMRKWREFFGIKQSQLASLLNVSPSVISDYESGRRKSPGSLVLRRFIETLIKVDEDRGGNTIALLSKTTGLSSTLIGIVDIKEFATPMSVEELVDRVKGEVLYGNEYLNEFMYGYTIIDSIEAIKRLAGFNDFMQLFGMTTERALIFTRVTTGRSPMIALKVVNIKPCAVVIHGTENADELAIELAKIMKIPFILSKAESVEEIINRMRGLAG